MEDEKMICDKEKAAREYAEDTFPIPDTDDVNELSEAMVVQIATQKGFLAGYNSRQPEIDKLKSTITELDKWDTRQCREIDELKKSLSESFNTNVSLASKLSECKERLNEATEWIPCSERLPENPHPERKGFTMPCLVKTQFSFLMVAYYDFYHECWNDDQDDDVLGYKVVAWRPIL